MVRKMEKRRKSEWWSEGGKGTIRAENSNRGKYISKTIDLLWDAVGAVGAVATHSRSVPQTYPPRPQHAHSSPARVHSTTEPRLRTTLPPRCGPCLNTRWSVFNLKTILLLAKNGNDNVDKGGDIHGIRE